jgi:hypothetical protein
MYVSDINTVVGPKEVDCVVNVNLKSCNCRLSGDAHAVDAVLQRLQLSKLRMIKVLRDYVKDINLGDNSNFSLASCKYLVEKMLDQ